MGGAATSKAWKTQESLHDSRITGGHKNSYWWFRGQALPNSIEKLIDNFCANNSNTPIKVCLFASPRVKSSNETKRQCLCGSSPLTKYFVMSFKRPCNSPKRRRSGVASKPRAQTKPPRLSSRSSAHSDLSRLIWMSIPAAATATAAPKLCEDPAMLNTILIPILILIII